MKTNNLEHLAVIMDGNGRWATKRGKPRLYGHKAGIESFKRTIKACLEFNIHILSVYAFSTENWSRPKEEVDGIMDLINEFCKTDTDFAVENGIQVVTMGDLSKLPENLQISLTNMIEKTINNNKLILNIGINYGARSEIIRALNLIIQDNLPFCDEQIFKKYLYTSNLPDPDLIIRASGEKRLSNFMLYQCAYSEFYFPKTHWPDFNKRVIKKAIKVYNKRNRRFGGLKNY